MPDGNALPVITGQNATTKTDLSYWNENRSVIKVGGSNLPTDQAAARTTFASFPRGTIGA